MNKEILGRIFTAYINIRLNPQREYRKEASEKLTSALDELKASGMTFDELATEGECRELLMLTESGMDNFIGFVNSFDSYGYNDDEDMSDIVSRQIQIAEWVNEHRKELSV